MYKIITIWFSLFCNLSFTTLSQWLHQLLLYVNIVLQCATADPDGRKRALLIGGGIANFTDVAATFSGIIRALKEKVCFLLFVYEYILISLQVVTLSIIN